jgi:hypothetical protein
VYDTDALIAFEKRCRIYSFPFALPYNVTLQYRDVYNEDESLRNQIITREFYIEHTHNELVRACTGKDPRDVLSGTQAKKHNRHYRKIFGEVDKLRQDRNL